MKKNKISIIIVVMIMLFCNVIPIKASDNSEARKNVKAGFFSWDGYHVVDESGVKSGYGYDFLKMTENYCNWKMEYVGYDKTWSDMLDMLDDGKIDILTSAQKTPEWEAKYDYSDQPIGTSSAVLSVRKEDTQYIIGDISTYNGMKIGCISDSSKNNKFAEFAEKNRINYTFIYYNNLDELKDALKNRLVDAILSTNLRTFNGETVLEEFDPVNYYAIVRKGDTEILSQINYAISVMNQNTPSWKEELQKKYFSDPDEEELIFNKDELDYLSELKKDNKEFIVVTNPDLAPYSPSDKLGNPVGIAPDLFKELAKRTGLKYKFVSFKTYEEYNEFVREGKADIDLTCFHDYGLAADHGIDITNSYMTTSLAILSRNTFKGNISKIAVVKGFYHNTIYSDSIFKDKNTAVYSTNKESIKAVSKGEVDVVYQYTYMAQKAVEEDVRNKLMYTILPQYEVELCIGVNENADYRLISVLNEGIRALSGKFTENLIQNEIMNISEKDNIISVIYDYPLYALIIVIFIVCVFLIIIYIVIKKTQTEKLLEKESEANVARTEFFMIISHELRTPLNAVVAYLRMIKEEYLNNDDELEYVKKAQSAASQLTEISDNMLDYSNISSGKIELKNEIIKLKDVILQVDENITFKANEKNQNYHFITKGISRYYLKGDALRLSSVFQNIMENAVKFTPEGGNIEVEIAEELIDKENINLIFTCCDSGKGMSKDFTKKIDSAFHQSDPSYSRTHGGIGLGLFLTQFFVKMMNGKFEVESSEGKGSRFKITIPMICPSINELVEHNIKCSKVRTIVFENDEYDIKMAKDTLNTIGVKSDVVGDADKLIKRIRSRVGGNYEYAACIINIDLLDDYKKIVNGIKSIEHGPEIFLLTDNQKLSEKIKNEEGVDYSIYKQNSYFELFNAFTTDFGEYKNEEKKHINVDYSEIHAMIVEDNKINADILKRMLEKAKIEVTVCDNGKKGVETFESAKDNTFQIIFMDIQMPEMDGHEATMKIRESAKEQGKTIPIIAVSANAFPEDVKMSLDAGMNAHIAKPVDEILLFTEMERFIELGKC